MQTPGTKFFVGVPDLDPTATFVTVFFALEQNPRSRNPADIAQLIQDLADNDEGIIVSPSNLVDSDYNVMLQIPQADFTQPNGVAYLGLDMTQISNIPDISGLFIEQVLVVPEPCSAGLLAVSGIALISRRRMRK